VSRTTLQKELECIKLSHKITAKQLEADLEQVRNTRFLDEYRVFTEEDDIPTPLGRWRSDYPGMKGYALWFAQYPIMWIANLLLYVCLPVAYPSFLSEKREKTKMLKDKITQCKEIPRRQTIPELKTIRELWRLNSPSNRGIEIETKVNLLDTWVTILYGSGAAEMLDVEGMLKDLKNGYVSEETVKYDFGKIRFHNTPIADLIAHRVSDTLPKYI
jgi:hypothetical protein